MIQLNRSMMDRYEIPDRRPDALRCLVFGADALMLGAACRLIDHANEQGKNIGAACICSPKAAECLNAQDGMFTLMIRGEAADASALREERVLQGVLEGVCPEEGFDRLMQIAALPELELIFCHAAPDDVETGLIARVLAERHTCGLPMPQLLCISAQAEPGAAARLQAAVRALARGWQCSLPDGSPLVCAALADTLCGAIVGAEREKRIFEMNYRDDMLAWAEPYLRLYVDGNMPALLEGVEGVCAAGNFSALAQKKARIFDCAVFLGAALGFVCGMDNFAQVMKDEQLRSWIGHAFFDEILPGLPYARTEIASEVISAFERLENTMNNMPLMEIGRDLLRRFPETMLPAIRAYADENFEAPRYLSLGLAAAIMVYAGARADGEGNYRVAHGSQSVKIYDDREILEDFSRLAHDMPAESLAYAALANRAAWGEDLREIPGLEMRVVFDLSAIQRIGLRQAMQVETEN